jgi:mRNA-degrading endonuclease RelE of RelBE toxin-antitoxin system
VRIDVHPRLRKHVEKLSATERRQIAAALSALANGFGNPHLHSGLGIRRLRKDLFECRAGLQWRILFFAEKGILTAYDVMTHDEIKAWLRSF